MFTTKRRDTRSIGYWSPDVSCLPTAIPERIDADVSALMIGNVLTVAELRAPEGVRILNDPGQAAAGVAPAMAEEGGTVGWPRTAARATPGTPSERSVGVRIE